MTQERLSLPWRVIQLESVGSTNHELRRLMHEGALAGTVVIAREQLAGRGREGRVWHSPPGNLYLSALLRLEAPSPRLPELSFVVALAVADAVDALLPPDHRAALKWPNDVLLGGAKTSGILIETAGDAAIVGIGVNVEHSPADTPYPATHLNVQGAQATVETTRDAVLGALAGRLAQWRQHGFDPIRANWLARAHPIGTALRVREPPLEGSFAGLDENGALLLDTEAGRRRIISGDVMPG